ncbi:hypothetical protein GIX45_00245 [Erwinia sp. CPCC 100877]|nr:hypothetical protein [Erwinia sp. CPCC 100877]
MGSQTIFLKPGLIAQFTSNQPALASKRAFYQRQSGYPAPIFHSTFSTEDGGYRDTGTQKNQWIVQERLKARAGTEERENRGMRPTHPGKAQQP